MSVLTFLASFRCLRCFDTLAFSILCRRRTVVRFDFGSAVVSTVANALERQVVY